METLRHTPPGQEGKGEILLAQRDLKAGGFLIPPVRGTDWSQRAELHSGSNTADLLIRKGVFINFIRN